MTVLMDKKTIIICDDNDPLVMIMSQFLRKNGYTVMTASDGREGLDLARSSRPDLLLLDLEMPGLDGMGVLKALSEMEGKKPYTVVITAQEGAQRKQAALALGAGEYWTKPFNAGLLLKRLQSLAAEGRL
jgi:DNA-binding response OmpR family regulator